MNFTGERVIPGEVDADLFNEHWARYLFAARYAAGKRVLDVACGSGYGSALLTKDAARVAGVDISREAVEYASRHYGSAKILFAQADCYSLPFVSAQFDLVVAFEIIEHLTDAASFLQEARRILAPAGLLLISTPNRLYYTEPSCRRFDAIVTRAFDHAGRPAVTLDRTAFYPSSGGQPFDTGRLGGVHHGGLLPLDEKVGVVVAPHGQLHDFHRHARQHEGHEAGRCGGGRDRRDRSAAEQDCEKIGNGKQETGNRKQGWTEGPRISSGPQY